MRSSKSHSFTARIALLLLIAGVCTAASSSRANPPAVGNDRSTFVSSSPSAGPVVMWAGRVLDANSGQGIYSLGAPDAPSANTLDAQTSTNPTGEYMRLGDFRGGFYPGLASLLRISESTLASADVIAFEVNGNFPARSGGWESCNWGFSDGTNEFGVNFNDGVAWSSIRGVVGNGSISGSSYDSFFGCSSESKVVSYILFDLPSSIDTSSPNFSIKIGAARHPEDGESTPDIDAVGVLSCAGSGKQ